MDFVPLTAREMKRSFFNSVYYAVWNTYDGRDDFRFLEYDGVWYASEHTKELDKLFPVIKNLDWSKRGWKDWTWYYMGMGGGAVFVHKYILDAYKKYAGIDDRHIEYGPDYKAAEQALEDLKDSRADRFTWTPSDLIICKQDEELTVEEKFIDQEKSDAYRELVEDMQEKYPAYGVNFRSKLPGNKSIAGEESKKIARDMYESFENIEEFYETLEEWGIDWQKNDNPKINRMWAINAFANALEDGFEFEKVVDKNFLSPLPLWAPVLNKENICKEINLYTYWQGFGYAKKTPKIKYLLVAQDWGNLFRRKPEDNQGFLKMNETGEWIAPYNEIPKQAGTDTNLIKLFAVLNRDLLKLNDDVFFTNFCLGYRSGNETGGMYETIMMESSEEFKRLCDILEPENILCLGQLTSECAYEALNGDGTWKEIYGGFTSYNDFLDNHAELTVNCGNTTTKFYPLAHCGVMGTLNRKFEDQVEDWKKILKPAEKVEKTEEPKIKRTALYGAILGDIIGSPYEFDSDVDGVKKTKDFTFFKGHAHFTDDTVMTIAVAEALLEVGRNANDEETVCNAVIKSMRKWGRKYPYAGYGGRFRKWLESENPQPYGSWGNGSAMRVSAAGWIFHSMFDIRECARMTARPTHNHPEGVKGAVAVASAIFLARKGKSKDDIKNYIETEFGYDLDRTLDEIRPFYRHDGSCQGTVPEAIIAFLESEDFEDAIRNAVSLGGDADTLTCITGSIAEAFYGIPEILIEKCREYLPKEILDVIDKFNACKGYILDDLENDSLEKKIAEYNKNPTEKNLQIVHEEIFNMLVKNHEHGDKLIGFFSLGDMKIDDNGREGFYPDYVEKNGIDYEVLYTNTAEMLKYTKISKYSEVGIVEIKEIFRIFEEVFDCNDYNLVINPYGGNPFFLDNRDFQKILSKFHEKVFGGNKNHVKFIRKNLSNDLLTKKFFEDARFIHTSASGAMGNAGVFEVWTKNFEHYYCHWINSLNLKKVHAAFNKSGWCFHYMGCGNNFYIKAELDAEYLKKFDEGLKNGANYPRDEDVFPVEEIMLELLAKPESTEDELKNLALNMESAINKFEMQDSVIAYRRADISLLDYFEKVLNSGGIVQDDGFITTTLLKIGSTENELEIKIIVPKGVGYGAYIAPMSIAPEECEFVLNRGTFFKVRKVDRENLQVVMEVVGRSPKELN